MEYTVQKLGRMAGISTRTLRYYDRGCTTVIRLRYNLFVFAPWCFKSQQVFSCKIHLNKTQLLYTSKEAAEAVPLQFSYVAICTRLLLALLSYRSSWENEMLFLK